MASVEEIWTVNSSLGMEALFWGKQVRIFGESPINPFFELPQEERMDFLVWFFLCYLISFDLLFDSEYYSWRLKDPSVGEIAERHISAYKAGPKLQWQSISFPNASDHDKLEVDFPSPQLALSTLARQNREIDEQRGYIKKLEDEVQALYPIVDERNILLGERDTLLGVRDSLLGERDDWIAHRNELMSQHDVLASQMDLTSNELSSIKRKLLFRVLKKLRFI